METMQIEVFKTTCVFFPIPKMHITFRNTISDENELGKFLDDATKRCTTSLVPIRAFKRHIFVFKQFPRSIVGNFSLHIEARKMKRYPENVN